MKLKTAIVLLLAFTAIGAGCGNGQGVVEPGEPGAEPVAGTQTHMEGRGADFRLFDGEPTFGPTRRPRLWLHVDWFSQAEENIWSFRDAHAVIYGRDEHMDDMYLEAGGGSYQEDKSAYLREGVVARIGQMTLELRDFEWLNEEGEGRSEYPLSVSTPDCDLKASSVRLYHKDRRILLTDVTGTLRLERAQP